MRVSIYNFALVLLIVFFASCSKDDAEGAQTNLDQFIPIDIKFVHADGTDISESECILPDGRYALQIEVEENNPGNTDVSQIEYTINGIAYSMSFSEAGVKRNPIALVDGKNIAELVKSAESTEIIFVEQDDFELVN